MLQVWPQGPPCKRSQNTCVSFACCTGSSVLEHCNCTCLVINLILTTIFPQQDQSVASVSTNPHHALRKGSKFYILKIANSKRTFHSNTRTFQILITIIVNCFKSVKPFKFAQYWCIIHVFITFFIAHFV